MGYSLDYIPANEILDPFEEFSFDQNSVWISHYYSFVDPYTDVIVPLPYTEFALR